MAGATVWAHPVNAIGHSTAIWFHSDAAGHFTIGNLEWGKYQIFAVKESDGYADLHWAIDDGGKVPEVVLSASAPAADAEVRFGPKAAVLTGSITDAVTGSLVVNPRIRIWRWTDGVDRDSEFADSNIEANYRFLIPPGKEVGLTIGAQGYETRTYCGESGGSKPFPLSLASGAAKTIDVKLRPLPK